MSQLTNEQKAVSILCRTGQPTATIDSLTTEEIGVLAAIYDECCTNELLLTDRIKAFWNNRQDRLDAAKATDDVQPKKAKAAPKL